MANILLIDDEEDLVDLIRFDLQRRGHVVEACLDGNEALSFIDKQRFDLIVTDLRIPGADGLAICRRVKEKPYTTPVIVMTGHSEVDSELKALGVKHSLRKPFPLSELATLVSALTRSQN